ncbi:hypothetical protein U0070_014439, partial [Myodes glareolus]
MTRTNWLIEIVCLIQTKGNPKWIQSASATDRLRGATQTMIYVIRNPRDVLVSGYFFLDKTNLIKNLESLKTYFEWFLKGNAIYSLVTKAAS